MEQLWTQITNYFDWFYIPRMKITDAIEIVFIAVLIYYIMDWFKKTRAWTLIKGILILLVFMGIAALLEFNTLIWIFKNTISVGVIAIIVIFQPEFRRALEQLGRKRFISSLFDSSDSNVGRRIDKIH